MNATMHHELDDAKIGDGVTVTIWSDRHACTVIARTKTTITLQRDAATLLNGFDSGEADALRSYPGGFAAHVEGRQRYSYKANPEGELIKITRRVLKPRPPYSDGGVIWKRAGCATRSPGNTASAGRHENYDYNF